MASRTDIACERIGEAGVVTLNRPTALNALNLGMVRGLAAALDAWEHDPAITRVIIRGAGEKAFCAGGDIRLLHDLGRAGQLDEARGFWREEYTLNMRIKAYPKPYIALIDGIVMGGGVGVSLHGSHVVAGERYLFAMPEVGIGFFPDVGASHALPRLPGATGTYLAVTGERVGPQDALALGLATHAVASAGMGSLLDALCRGEAVEAALLAHAAPGADAPILARRKLIDQAFAADSMEDIIARLHAARDPLAATLLERLATKSPTSIKIALRQMRAGCRLGFEEAMQMEYRIVNRIIEGHDFYEGVRALIIDKDQRPDWKPARIGDVTEDMVSAYFAPLASELPGWRA